LGAGKPKGSLTKIIVGAVAVAVFGYFAVQQHWFAGRPTIDYDGPTATWDFWAPMRAARTIRRSIRSRRKTSGR